MESERRGKEIMHIIWGKGRKRSREGQKQNVGMRWKVGENKEGLVKKGNKWLHKKKM